ncbi:sigma factor [Lentzea sp. NPDC051208]|uniref:sigma factor n=1 Tax=Lentzea sp. NPDC051208 TaxID=3154642 RepID=UPI003414B976
MVHARSSLADEVLIRWLFEEHGRAVLAYATRLCGDRTTAEDVAQEVFLRAWRNPEVLGDSKRSVRGRLLAVVYSIAIGRRRTGESDGTPPAGRGSPPGGSTESSGKRCSSLRVRVN